MANAIALGVGAFLLFNAVVALLVPNSAWNEDSRDTLFGEMTLPELLDFCSSGMGQMGQAFSGDMQEGCSLIRTLTYATYGIGLLGLILIIVGAVVPGKPKVMSKMNCGQCGAVVGSKTKFCRKCGSYL